MNSKILKPSIPSIIVLVRKTLIKRYTETQLNLYNIISTTNIYPSTPQVLRHLAVGDLLLRAGALSQDPPRRCHEVCGEGAPHGSPRPLPPGGEKSKQV